MTLHNFSDKRSQSLSKKIEDQRDYEVGVKALKEHKASGGKTHSVEAVAQEFGVKLERKKVKNLDHMTKKTVEKKLTTKDKLGFGAIAVAVLSFVMIFFTSLNSIFFYLPFFLIPVAIVLLKDSEFVSPTTCHCSNYGNGHRCGWKTSYSNSPGSWWYFTHRK